jgi:hypothetical protein
MYYWSRTKIRLVNIISTLHTAAVVDDSSRRIGVTKKKPKCIADYNTHMHGVDTADQYLACYNTHMHGVDTADQYLACYNTHMHGVDTADPYLAYYPFIRKIVKWHKKVFSTFSNVHFSIVMLYLQNPTLIPTNHS